MFFGRFCLIPLRDVCISSRYWNLEEIFTKSKEMHLLAFRCEISVLFEKMSVGGGLGALQFFRSLKKGTRTFNFR